MAKIAKDIVVFIFRRDFRVEDNMGFNAAIEYATSIQAKILPIFIFSPKQIDPKVNTYYNPHAIRFMIESLQDLHTYQLHEKLLCFHGDDIDIIENMCKLFHVKAIAWNTDITQFAKKRDADIRLLCEKRKIDTITNASPEYTLFHPSDITTQNGGTYQVFTPFYRNVLQRLREMPIQLQANKKVPKDMFLDISSQKQLKYIVPIDTLFSLYVVPQDTTNDIKGGRAAAKSILQQIRNRAFIQYDAERDIPALAKTTRLSAYLKFGCVSIREAFVACKDAYGLQHGLIRELLWREFYAHITFHTPALISPTKNQTMHMKYNTLPWITQKNHPHYKAWCNGQTGFPIVDAAMRCMNETGWMHNRLRMVVASFLTKDLRIDWRLGEQYFARMLTDYDPASNSGGWQWAAGVGADAQPYYRIFNPWLQSAKYDPDALFIRTWLPMLNDIPVKHIHTWYTTHSKHQHVQYPAPIIDHTQASKETLIWYKKHVS